MHQILRFVWGLITSHLSLSEGRHMNQPRASRVFSLRNTGALGDERHMLLECPAVAGFRLQFTLAVLFQRHQVAPLSQGPA